MSSVGLSYKMLSEDELLRTALNGVLIVKDTLKGDSLSSFKARCRGFVEYLFYNGLIDSILLLYSKSGDREVQGVFRNLVDIIDRGNGRVYVRVSSEQAGYVMYTSLLMILLYKMNIIDNAQLSNVVTKLLELKNAGELAVVEQTVLRFAYLLKRYAEALIG